MVQATTMTAVMAEKDPPVFRDFLGIGRKDDATVKQPQPSPGVARRNTAGFDDDGEAEISTRASSGTSGRFETCSAPGILPPFSSAFPSTSDPGSGIRLNLGKVVCSGWIHLLSYALKLQCNQLLLRWFRKESSLNLIVFFFLVGSLEHLLPKFDIQSIKYEILEGWTPTSILKLDKASGLNILIPRRIASMSQIASVKILTSSHPCNCFV